MGQVDEDLNASSSNRTTTFNAESYKQFLYDAMDVYGCDFQFWSTALIGNNVSSNRPLAMLVECHKLDVQIIASTWR